MKTTATVARFLLGLTFLVFGMLAALGFPDMFLVLFRAKLSQAE